VGETQNQPFQFSFNVSLKVDFQGSRVTSDGGLILVRELDASTPGITGCWPDASTDLCGAERVAFRLRLQNPEPMEEGRSRV